MVLKCDDIFCVGCVVPMWIGYLIMRYNRLNNTSSSDEADANANKCPNCRKEVFKINHNREFDNTILDIKDWGERYAALKVIQKQLKDYIPKSADRLFLVAERITAQRKLVANAVEVIQRAKRGETIPTGTIKSIEKVDIPKSILKEYP